MEKETKGKQKREKKLEKETENVLIIVDASYRSLRSSIKPLLLMGRVHIPPSMI
jgi:hypothetical protein